MMHLSKFALPCALSALVCVAIAAPAFTVDATSNAAAARTFMPNIEASGHKKIVSLSSGLGSLARVPDFAQNVPGYDYAISKAGLNISMRMLAYEVKSRGVLVGLTSPGAIDTAMQTQVRAASAAEGKPITTPVVTPAESARGVVDFIIALDADKSGRFFSYTGAEIPW